MYFRSRWRSRSPCSSAGSRSTRGRASAHSRRCSRGRRRRRRPSIRGSTATSASAPARAAKAHACERDLVIVGAGPAGLAAALEAQRRGVRYELFEKGTFGGAILSYPRAKIVMTAPLDLPGIGQVKLRRTTKEALLELFQTIARETQLEITENTDVTAVQPIPNGLVVQGGGRRLPPHRAL